MLPSTKMSAVVSTLALATVPVLSSMSPSFSIATLSVVGYLTTGCGRKFEGRNAGGVKISSGSREREPAPAPFASALHRARLLRIVVLHPRPRGASFDIGGDGGVAMSDGSVVEAAHGCAADGSAEAEEEQL